MGRWPPWAASAAVLLGLVALAEVVARLGLASRTVLAAPSTVLGTALGLAQSGEVWPHAARTLGEFALGVTLAVVMGLALGAAFWRVPQVARSAQPWLVGLHAMPFIVFYPVLLVILGLGPWPIVVIAAMMGMIPMALSTWVGLRGIPEVYFKVAAVARCPRLLLFVKVVLPAAAPLLFAGLKLAVVYAFIGVISMEFMTAEAGLGFLVGYYYELFQGPLMWAYMAWIVAIALILTGLLLWSERRIRAEL